VKSAAFSLEHDPGTQADVSICNPLPRRPSERGASEKRISACLPDIANNAQKNLPKGAENLIFSVLP